MHLPRSHPHPGGLVAPGRLAASGLLLGGSLAAARLLAHRLLRKSVAAGEVLQRRMLGTEASYRVLDAATETAETVEVEVLAAPGLKPGMHLRLSAADARAGGSAPPV